MNNIFENAKFGDKFLTRDGRIAVLVYISLNSIDTNLLAKRYYHYFVDGCTIEFKCTGTGFVINNDKDNDIISRYPESIDEEKLDKLVDYWLDDAYCDEGMELERNAAKCGCKIGYHKAKE